MGGRLRRRIGFTLLPLLMVMAAPPAQPLPQEHRSFFVQPPWRVQFRSYDWYVADASPSYYFTVTMPEQAGAPLAGLVIQQIRGVDRHFRLAPSRARAFLGQPRREGQAVAVQASMDQDQRRFTATFEQPVQPGQTVTLVLRPWRNPEQSDTYVFSVKAVPLGDAPVPAPLGVATMAIFEASSF